MSEGIWTTVKDSINHIQGLIPDSILFGSILLYFLTQNIAFGIFAVFIFETVLSHKLISWVIGQTVGQSSRTMEDETFIKCHSGFRNPRLDAKMFTHRSYPSYAIFSITTIGMYLMMAMREFSDTLKKMEEVEKKQNTNGTWTARGTVSYIFISIVVLSIIIYRYNSCEDGILEILVAFICAVINGLVFFYINRAIVGQEAMNFLGLPYIVSKDSEGASIYVCSTPS